MSEPVKITSVEKTKDPRRVEAGKKLGAISRQAKERKAAQKQVEEEKKGSYVGVDRSEFSTLAAVFAAAAVIGVIAIQYRSLSMEPSKEDDPQGDHIVVQVAQGNSKEPRVVQGDPQGKKPRNDPKTPRSRLDSLD